MSVNEMLARAYGTFDPPTPSTEDAEKVAHFELFAKVAAANGIDLEKCTTEEMNGLWNTFQTKLAEQAKEAAAAPPAADPAAAAAVTTEKKAEAELAQIKEAEQKVAEADYLGQVMAHSYVATLKKIAAGGGFKFAEKEEKKDDHDEDDKKKNPFANFGKEMKGKKDEGKDEGKKEASAIDVLAAHAAVKLAHENGIDAQEAGSKLDALFSSGKIAATTKVAAATTVPEATHIRALELLEQCGYPVKWN